jgi:acyl phosphate:glycerol-3-phosphate acyltransferase
MIAWIFGTLAMAYLLGSIPCGLLLARMAGLGDIRKIGSGNIGATNVMRTGHKELAILTLLLDAGKGYLAVAATRYIYSADFAPLAGLFAVLGHMFPVWLRFKGGKGVATTIGVYFAIDWMLGLSVCAIWLLAFAMIRISSLASMLSIGYSAIVAYIIVDYPAGLLCLALATLIIFAHRANIKRLLEGTEHSFGMKNP